MNVLCVLACNQDLVVGDVQAGWSEGQLVHEQVSISERELLNKIYFYSIRDFNITLVVFRVV